jgi:hypothetical protein
VGRFENNGSYRGPQKDRRSAIKPTGMENQKTRKKTGGTCHESSTTEETVVVRRKGSFQPATVLVA